MILLSACDRILNVVKTAYLPVGAAATAAAPVPVPGEPHGNHRGPFSGAGTQTPGRALGIGPRKGLATRGPHRRQLRDRATTVGALRQAVPLPQARGGLTRGLEAAGRPSSRGAAGGLIPGREASSRGREAPSRGGKAHPSGGLIPEPGGLIKVRCLIPGGRVSSRDPEASSRAQKPHPRAGSSSRDPEASSRAQKPHPRAGGSSRAGGLIPRPG
jgi:hypothetical protein